MKTARASLPLCVATAIATVAGATAVFGVATAADPTSQIPQDVQHDAPAALTVEAQPWVDPVATAWPSLDATSAPLFEQAAYQVPWGAVSRMPGQHVATPSSTPTPKPTPKPTPRPAPQRFAAAVRAPAPYVRPRPTPRPVVRTPAPVFVAVPSVATARSYALSVVGSSQFTCLDALFARESNWNPFAYNSSTGAYGIPQALPGIKMAAVGADWRTDPVTQVKWGLSYIAGSYGTPCAAWSHELSAGWY